LTWRIELTDTARKQLAKLGQNDAKRISRFLRERVAVLDSPRQIGKPLRGQLTELWRYRVGDYRLICELQDHALVVLVVRVGHRNAVYR
jgi:mRNA interferase RelE/StbE